MYVSDRFHGELCHVQEGWSHWPVHQPRKYYSGPSSIVRCYSTHGLLSRQVRLTNQAHTIISNAATTTVDDGIAIPLHFPSTKKVYKLPATPCLCSVVYGMIRNALFIQLHVTLETALGRFDSWIHTIGFPMGRRIARPVRATGAPCFPFGTGQRKLTRLEQWTSMQTPTTCGVGRQVSVLMLNRSLYTLFSCDIYRLGEWLCLLAYCPVGIPRNQRCT